MGKLLKKSILFLVLWGGIFSVIRFTAWAITIEECESKLSQKQISLSEAQECESLLGKLYQETGEKKRTLQNEIGRFNTAMAITSAKIVKTNSEIEALEKEILSLATKIDKLDISLDQLTKVLIRRIAETYKKGRQESVALFFSSSDFAEFISRYKYLKVVQVNDRKIMVQMEDVRTNFEDQKTVKEQKQTELETAKKKLESQKNLLVQQKADKENLLKITQNNEIKYQQLLTASRQEIEAIQGIIAGKGEETEVGRVNQGSRIASVITGASACSTGTHLHFQVTEGTNVKDPFSYLKNINLIDDSGGDPHAASGSWDWPLNEPIRFTQGFGTNTSAIRSKIVWYSFHTGIDIVSEDRTVKAVKSGTLYQGGIACGGGTLRYVRVRHDEANLDTYYLHVNY